MVTGLYVLNWEEGSQTIVVKESKGLIFEDPFPGVKFLVIVTRRFGTRIILRLEKYGIWGTPFNSL